MTDNLPTLPQRYGTAFHLRPPQVSLLAGELIKAKTIFIQAGQVLDVNADTLAEPLIIHVAKNAKLKLASNLSSRDVVISNLVIYQAAQSEVTLDLLRARNNYAYEKIDIYLQGEQAKCQVNHYLLASNGEQADIAVRIKHEASNTQSNVTAKASAADQSTVVYRALTNMSVGLKAVQGQQTAAGLLLSRHAAIDFLPELSISTNDVSCTHAAAVGHLNSELTTYLRSRGLLQKQAEHLATLAFYCNNQLIPDELLEQLKLSIYDDA